MAADLLFLTPYSMEGHQTWCFSKYVHARKKICLVDLWSEPCTYITKYAAWNCVVNELETKSTVHLILISQNHTVMLWNGIYRQRQWLYHGKCPALLRPSQQTRFCKDPEQPVLRELSRTREGAFCVLSPFPEPRMVNHITCVYWGSKYQNASCQEF